MRGWPSGRGRSLGRVSGPRYVFAAGSRLRRAVTWRGPRLHAGCWPVGVPAAARAGVQTGEGVLV